MSLLLDAIKQSGQHEQTAAEHDQAALQLKQQQELTRYRRLALSFGLLLAAILTLMAGFSIGKWLQNNKSLDSAVVTSTQQTLDKKETVENTEQAATDAAQTAAQPHAINAAVTSTQLPQPSMQQMPVQGQQYQWVQVPVNSVPVYVNQGQPVYQQPIYQGQPIYQTQPQFSQPVQMTQNNSSRQVSDQGIDLSKYKVLGKPLNSEPSAPPQQTLDNDELKDVPDTLKDAFAKAVQDVDSQHFSEVTHSTKNSSYAEPIELLPVSLQNQLPTIKYQAHIYASETSKRWIKLNGRELYEGDSIGVLSVVEITPEQSLLSYDGYEFTLKALQDWPE
ncbi:general secretion pathway protein GspB [Pseudoalteromonas sp. PB2-1]|uniref:general secretion pathway protein GspB n=1 Tax=Pseudoalteromonas sp. PB2-1 TaxID=2907242 RepID=UPI003870C5AF